MVVNNKTLWAALKPIYNSLFDDKEKARLKQAAAICIFGDAGYYGLSIAELAEILANDKEFTRRYTPRYNRPTCTAFEYLAIEGLRDFIKQYPETLKRFNYRNADIDAASAACIEVSMIEGLLIFAREYFGLPNFEAASKITLADLMIAKKDSYNKVVFQKKLSEIQSNKLKK